MCISPSSTDPTEAESERDHASQTQNPMQDLFGRLDGPFVWKLESSGSRRRRALELTEIGHNMCWIIKWAWPI
jgi:hypothetical protein